MQAGRQEEGGRGRGGEENLQNSCSSPRVETPPCLEFIRWWTKDLTRLRQNYSSGETRQGHNGEQVGLAPTWKLELKMHPRYHRCHSGTEETHWEGFLAEDANIWKAARYLQPGKDTMEDKVPPLKREDGSEPKRILNRRRSYLTFLPAITRTIEAEVRRPHREALSMPDLRWKKSREDNGGEAWKAPGEDGLPAMVWKAVACSEVPSLDSFRLFTPRGCCTHQWRSAKIIPLKKPDKGDYTIAKAWRPISLLSTLGKIMEAVIAERISYALRLVDVCPQTTSERERDGQLSKRSCFCRNTYTRHGGPERC